MDISCVCVCVCMCRYQRYSGHLVLHWLQPGGLCHHEHVRHQQRALPVRLLSLLQGRRVKVGFWRGGALWEAVPGDCAGHAQCTLRQVGRRRHHLSRDTCQRLWCHHWQNNHSAGKWWRGNYHLPLLLVLWTHFHCVHTCGCVLCFVWFL